MGQVATAHTQAAAAAVEALVERELLSQWVGAAARMAAVGARL